MSRIRTHPGEILREEYLVPLGLSARALAEALRVPSNRISEILRGRRDVTADTAIRLGRYFGTAPQFWLNLQSAHNLSMAQARTDYGDIRLKSRRRFRQDDQPAQRQIRRRSGEAGR